MAYQRIFWKDRIVVLNDDGTINKIIQEGTYLLLILTIWKKVSQRLIMIQI